MQHEWLDHVPTRETLQTLYGRESRQSAWGGSGTADRAAEPREVSESETVACWRSQRDLILR